MRFGPSSNDNFFLSEINIDAPFSQAGQGASNVHAHPSTNIPEFYSFQGVGELKVRRGPFISDFFAIFER
jgi:hypothetical protein